MIKTLKNRKWKKIIKKSGLFDIEYYLFTYPDVRRQDINPVEHYIKSGAKEGRNPSKDFDTNFYLTQYKDVKNINPLVHYILYGKKEKRNISGDINTNINQRSLANNEKSTSVDLNKLDILDITEQMKKLKTQDKYDIAVVLHIYYPELIKEISLYLNNISDEYVLFVTFPKNKRREIKPLLNQLLNNRIEIEVENEGYDILPFLRLLPILEESNFKYFCKIHTKRDHDEPSIGQYWRESLLDGVLGSKKLVKDIIKSFENNNNLYMVGSKLNYLSYQATKYDNENNVKRLSKNLNINLDEMGDFGFIAGTIFWGRVDSFRVFNKSLVKIQKENSLSGVTSSIFHAVERLFGVLTLKNKSVGLVDYKLKLNNVEQFIEIPREPKALILEPKYRFKAFRIRNKYLDYLLLSKSSLLDAYWCYENYIKSTKTWEDCLILFIYDQIEYLSKKHKNEVSKLEFNDDKLNIFFKNNVKETVELESYNLSENLTSYRLYEDTSVNNNSDIKVSVIVATYNHEKFIEQALESIASQKTNFKFEILVGDDCSTDKTPSIINKIAQKYPDKMIPIIRDENIGVYNNFQDLFNLAQGKYIALNEGDDFWVDNNKLQIQVDYLEKHQECSVCFHPVNVIDEETDKIEGVFPANLAGNKFSFERLFQSNIIQTNSVMYRNNIQNNQQLNPATLPLDWFWHMQNSLYGEIHMIPKVMATYRKHQGGIWSKKSLFFRENSEGNILVFTEINKLSNQMLHNEIIVRVVRYFDNLYWHYFEGQDIEQLFNLITLDEKLANLFFKLNQIPILSEKIKNSEDLLSKYKEIYKIDVIITSYNHQDYIAQTLRSVIYQKGLFSINLIVADDCSTDQTMNVITNTLNENKNMHNVNILKNTGNLGMLRNMKNAFSKADGKYIAICEGDDYWISEEKLHKQLLFMLQNPSVSMCFNMLLLEYLDANYSAPHPGQFKLQEKFIDFDFILKTAITANFSCCFYKTEMVRKVPDIYYEGKGNADWLFNLYMANFAEIGFLRDILSVYRVHSNGQWSGLSEVEQRNELQRMYKEYIELFPQKKKEISQYIVQENLLKKIGISI